MSKNQTRPKTKAKKHVLRTLIAALLGTAASLLVIVSVLIVWANQSLLNTDTYVSTVAPLASSPALKSYVVGQLSDNIIKMLPLPQSAPLLLPADEISGRTPTEITTEVKAVINQSLDQVINAPAFKQLWINSNRSLHASLISQLDANDPTINLDLRPTLLALLQQLGQTKLAPFAQPQALPASAGQVVISGNKLIKIHKSYVLFQRATWAIVALTIVLIVLAFWVSVHHQKTIRRIMVFTGALCLIIGLALSAPSVIGGSIASHGTNTVIAVDIVKLLIRRLQLSFLIIGAVLIVGAIVSKIVSHYHSSQ